MLESVYQGRLIKKLHIWFPGCQILKNDSSYLQGIPDLTLLYGPYWAWLEVKPSVDAPQQPNQEYYIDWAQRMSFGAFIYPENEEEVLYAFQQLSKSDRETRLSKRK